MKGSTALISVLQHMCWSLTIKAYPGWSGKSDFYVSREYQSSVLFWKSYQSSVFLFIHIKVVSPVAKLSKVVSRAFFSYQSCVPQRELYQSCVFRPQPESIISKLCPSHFFVRSCVPNFPGMERVTAVLLLQLYCCSSYRYTAYSSCSL